MITKVRDLELKGVVLLHSKRYEDERGLFYESFNQEQFDEIIGLPHDLIQDNISISHKNVFRGLHYQAWPKTQGKLVSVIKGSVLDIIVDVRTHSKTFGQHVKIELSDKNGLMVWIPRGFAHGFLALEDNTIFQYKVDNVYDKKSERSINVSDPQLKLGLDLHNVILSTKDREADFMNVFDEYFDKKIK